MHNADFIAHKGDRKISL